MTNKLNVAFVFVTIENEPYIERLASGGMNLRTEMHRILADAGLIPWPKTFHNLRASCESELMRKYDLKTVCGWIGNSPEVPRNTMR